MTQICAKIPIPTFNSIYAAALPSMVFPPGNIKVPSLPGIPSSVFPGLQSTNLEILQIVEQLQTYQFLLTFEALLLPLTKFLGIPLDSILPKIPGTALSLIDLLALTPAKIYSTITVMLKQTGYLGIPAKAGLPSLLGVPNPLSYSIAIPAFNAITAVKGLINGYMSLLITTIINLINQVVSKLQLPGLPTIPSIPSLAGLQSTIIPTNLPIPQVTAVLSGYSLNTLLAKAPIPGFPSLPALPSPLVPSLNSPEFNFFEGLGLLYTHLISYPLTIIVNFVQKILGFLGFTFPTICVSY